MSYFFVDLLIYLWLLAAALEGSKKGAYRAFIELIALLGGLFFGLKYYYLAADNISHFLNFPTGISNLLSFVILMLTFIFLFFLIAEPLTNTLNNKIAKVKGEKYWYKLAGALIESAKVLVVASVVLSVLVSFPINIYTKKLVLGSPTGMYLADKVIFTELSLKEVFAKPVEEGIFFKAVSTARNSTPPKPGKPPLKYLKRLPSQEEAMHELLNDERRKAGVGLLLYSKEVSNIAAMHSLDMFKRNYFNHVSPDNDDISDRLASRGIEFRYAGENIALAGNIATAHQGFIKSEGHRLNMLDPNFRKVGIGIIDGGPFQQIITQNFTD